MTLKRMWWMVRLAFTRGGGRRAEYCRRAGVYAGIGDNVTIQSRIIPIYSELIRFGNNVHVARNVDFVTHDIMHLAINSYLKNHPELIGAYHFNERIGCIDIKDNVFIGSNSVILYNTSIGPNVFIASGSVVTKDCEPDSIYAGCPAKKIGTFEEFIKKRKSKEERGLIATTTHNQHLTDDEILNAWKVFEDSQRGSEEKL